MHREAAALDQRSTDGIDRRSTDGIDQRSTDGIDTTPTFDLESGRRVDLELLVPGHARLTRAAEAFTHPSFANEKSSRAPDADYQRLEFLGDAVLSLLVSEDLMRRFPNAREGELSIFRAHIVSTKPLAAFARRAGIGALLRVGRGAEASGERDRDNVLADATEALIGAIYVDRGLDGARDLTHAIVESGLASSRPVRDAKSALQEHFQARTKATPTYRVVASGGPDHARTFEVEVLVDGVVLARGAGSSKKAAEQNAASVALDALSRGDR